MANQLTQKWKIKELKGVGDVELSLDASKRVFVFFGSNGVGKTKTLEALLYFSLAAILLYTASVLSLLYLFAHQTQTHHPESYEH